MQLLRCIHDTDQRRSQSFTGRTFLALALEMDALWRERLKRSSTALDCESRMGGFQKILRCLEASIPEIYGTIEREAGRYTCTRPRHSVPDAVCVVLESTWRNDHIRFDLLYESNPKEWDYLMFHMCKDKDGNDYGWAKGPGLYRSGLGSYRRSADNCKGQMSLEDFIK